MSNNSTRNSSKNGTKGFRSYKYRRLPSLENGIGHTSADEDEEEEIDPRNTVELRRKGPSRNGAEGGSSRTGDADLELVERSVEPGESLRSLSLKYRIPLAELKRVNKLGNESEFYALRTVKIPVRPFSVLSEILEQEQLSQQAEHALRATTGRTRTSSLLGSSPLGSISSDSEDMHVGYVSINRILKDKNSRREAERFLRNMQKDLEDIRKKTNSYKDTLDEATSALTDIRFHPLQHRGSSTDCSGSDWGISWWRLLLMAALLLVVTPVVYYLYFHTSSATDHNSNLPPSISDAAKLSAADIGSNAAVVLDQSVQSVDAT